MATQTRDTMPARFEAGQRLYCPNCGSEVEVITPCTCQAPHQELRCCGGLMLPSVGREVKVGVE